jgi:hypothetical protein
MPMLQQDIRSWGLVDITRARSSGRPVNGHVVKHRPSIEIDYEKARHLVHLQSENAGERGVEREQGRA